MFDASWWVVTIADESRVRLSQSPHSVVPAATQAYSVVALVECCESDPMLLDCTLVTLEPEVDDFWACSIPRYSQFNFNHR